jgi:hypothetical protein
MPPMFFSAPALLKNSAGFSNIFAKQLDDKDLTPQGKLQHSLRRYSKAFPANDECLRRGKVVCPLLPAMGLDIVQAAFQELIQPTDCVKSQLPSYMSLTNQVQLYGSLKDAVHFGTEPSCLSSLWYQHAGVTKFILAPATTIQKSIDGAKREPEKWVSLRDALRSLTEQDVKTFKEKTLPVYHGALEEGMILMVPAGFTFATCAAPQADKDQIAIKTFFLPSKAAAATSKQLVAVKSFNPPVEQLKVVDMLLDLCVVSKMAT